MEMAGGGAWTDEFKQKILWSAAEVGHKFRFDEAHSLHVTELARTLFHALEGEHMLGPRHELLMTVAAVLHDVGLFISSSNHHKHSMYLIQNSELFGLSAGDVFLVSQIARYHRRASPKPSHLDYMALPREDRLAVSQMAAILRVADALDLSHSQRIHDLSGHREEDRFVIGIPDVEDFSLEQMALKQKGPLFEDVYGMSVLLRKRRT
jgi:exopolyphosphatase/guanosine-5'-triphosphate,3'-diphosphate pyrophosphatase